MSSWSVQRGLAKHTNRKNGATKTATRARAEDVAMALKTLGDEAALPRLTVQSDDLHRIAPLLGAVGVGDKRGVAARLEALEISTHRNMDELRRRIQSKQMFQATPRPDLAWAGGAGIPPGA